VLLFAHRCERFMTSSSVSFRISRHTEDLAQTIHALSQRVVQLEQRFLALEAQLCKPKDEVPSEEHLASLANVDQLLRDCRELLGETAHLGGAPQDGPAFVRALPDPAVADPFEEEEAMNGLEVAA
jgi:hypothetical protein